MTTFAMNMTSNRTSDDASLDLPAVVDSRVLRAQAGDLPAFNDLVSEYERTVYSLCYRITGGRESAEDAAQEAFIAAWRNITHVRPESFRPWLYRIASNTAKTYLRKQRRRAETALDDVVEMESSDPTPEVQAVRQELKEDVAWGLAQLPMDQRQAIVLWHQAGLNYDEIAQATGVSLGTVKSRLFRGRKRLHEVMSGRLQETVG